MRSTQFRSGVVATISLGILLAAGGTAATASASTGSSTENPAVDNWVVPQTQEGGGEYWTSARMQAAVPGDVLVDDNVDQQAAVGYAAAGSEVSVEAQAPKPRITPFATRQTPIDTIGKVFFTLGGQDYVCSANSIASANENTVVTAGHCLNEGPGDFASRFTFVPAYENGNAPFGQWAATELFAPTEWVDAGNITYDTGFAVVSSPNGSSLSDTVGASGVTFNQARGLSYSLYGYPAASPFTGETLQRCAGRATADPFGQSQSQGVPCDMTGGSSGGPWFIGTGSAGQQNSVNSFGYNSVRNTMFGPYWGSVIQSAYAQASA